MILARKEAVRRIPREPIISSPPREKRALRTQHKSLSLIVLLAVAVLGFIIVFRFAQIQQLKRQIIALEVDLNNVYEEYNAINLQVAKLKSPDVIRTIATRECGLIIPTEDQFVTINTKP